MQTSLTTPRRTFEGSQQQLISLPFPSLFARSAIAARARLQAALRHYFRNNHDSAPDVSELVKLRAATNRKWGLPLDDVADNELGILFVSVTNAIPTMFWMVVYIFRDAKLVADLQAELLENVVVETKTEDGKRECSLDVSKFMTALPLLNSVYREVMRLTNHQQAPRTTLQDVVLTYTPPEGGDPRQYLLKKGVQCLSPALTTNFAPETWGPDAYVFDPRRFVGKSRADEKAQNRAANPFGGGKHLCPGRHFAYAEILGTAAALVLGFEIEKPGGSRVEVPQKGDNLMEAVAKPSRDVQQGMRVRIRRRREYENVKWSFSVGDGR